jgi:hypothetical protein
MHLDGCTSLALIYALLLKTGSRKGSISLSLDRADIQRPQNMGVLPFVQKKSKAIWNTR